MQNNVSVEELAEIEVSNIVLEDTSDQKLPSSKEEAFEYIPQGGISIFNGDIGANIKVGRKAVKHTALHHQKDEYAIFAGIQQIIANAVKVGNIPVAEDEIGHTHSVSIMYVPINVNGTQYSARLLVKELENKGIVLEELSLYNVSMHKERGSAIQPLNASDEVGGITAKPRSFYKVKELIHNSQEIDKKNLGINEVTRFSLITPEMDTADARQSLYNAPFFNDEDGEVIYFEDDEIELPAIEVRPRTTEGMIKIYMDKRHLAAKAAS